MLSNVYLNIYIYIYIYTTPSYWTNAINIDTNVISRWLSLWFFFLEKCGVILLTHWGRVTNKCVSKLTIIGSGDGLSPDRCQAIIWTNAGILLIAPVGTNFSELLIKVHTYSFSTMHLNMSSEKWQPPCLGLKVLKEIKSLKGLHVGLGYCIVVRI